MIINVFNYKGEAKQFEIRDDATFAHVEVITGNEKIQVYTVTDNNIICEYADCGGRALDFHDWDYIVDLRNEEERNRWLNRECSQDYY